jgi:hypothetical protein
VEIVDAEFNTVRGVQALTKDAVISAQAKINQAEFEWPFNASEETDTLTAGTEEYVWPTYFKSPDWNSFQIQKSDSLGVDFTTLKFMDRDEYYQSHRDVDQNSGVEGRGTPLYVFPSHGNGYGVTPSPDKAYISKYRYYLLTAALINPIDQTRIPDSFDSVLVDGALYQMYMFKDNMEMAQAAFIAFEQGLKNLQTLYINNYEYIRDTRVRF